MGKLNFLMLNLLNPIFESYAIVQQRDFRLHTANIVVPLTLFSKYAIIKLLERIIAKKRENCKEKNCGTSV